MIRSGRSDDAVGLTGFNKGEHYYKRGLMMVGSPIAGVIGHTLSPFKRKEKLGKRQELMKADRDAGRDIYSEAQGQDTTTPDLSNAYGGGQGTQKKASCMAFCVSTKGTGRSGLKYCKKSCKGIG